MSRHHMAHQLKKPITFETLYTSDNTAIEYKWTERFSFAIVSNAYFSVDSFFLLSVLLTCFLFMKEMKKRDGKLTAGFMANYYVHRFWRLTPAYALVLLLDIALTGYLGDGPFFPKGAGFEVNKCRDTWWTNLLYVNNLVKSDKNCYTISWYLANDMQFHWLAPVILIPLALKKNRLGFIISGIILLASVLSIGLILNAFPGAELGSSGPQADLYNKYVFNAPWARIGPFIVGLVFGYLIYAVKTKIMAHGLTAKKNFIGWFLALFFTSILVFGLYPDSQGNPLSRTAHILYECFSRTIWAIALGFMIYSCVTGNGGVINKILSWQIWTPLARISYSAYLIHQIVLLYFYITMERPLYVQDQTMIYLVISHTVLSYAAAFIVSIFLEAPFIALEKYIFTFLEVKRIVPSDNEASES